MEFHGFYFRSAFSYRARANTGFQAFSQLYDLRVRASGFVLL